MQHSALVGARAEVVEDYVGLADDVGPVDAVQQGVAKEADVSEAIDVEWAGFALAEELVDFALIDFALIEVALIEAALGAVALGELALVEFALWVAEGVQ